MLHKEDVPAGFDRVARAYDRLTGMNPGYHEHLLLSAERMRLRPDARVLDLCCGTGASTAALRRAYPRAELTGLDASGEMLRIAREKPGLGAVRWLEGDAMDPAAAGASGPYDGIFMAYGIRNVPDADACLAAIRELLVPGGVVCFHEYSVRDSARSRLVWNAVSSAIILPAALITARRASLFRYLRQSVNEFDGVLAFEERLRRAGFSDVRTGAATGWQRGIVHSFVARRPA